MKPPASMDIPAALREFGKSLKPLLRLLEKPVDVRIRIEAWDQGSSESDLEAQWRQIVDPMFGQLVWDLGWQATVNIPGIAQGMRVMFYPFDGIEQLPGKEHRSVFLKFMAVATVAMKRVDQANWEYYQKYRREYYDETDPVLRRALPALKSAAQLRKFLGPPLVMLRKQSGRAWEVDLIWESRWDPDHGHHVLLLNGKVQYVGTQSGG